MQAFLATKGKKIIGWDEILEGELAKGATVMSWRGVDGGKEAASHGFDAIMTPTRKHTARTTLLMSASSSPIPENVKALK